MQQTQNYARPAVDVNTAVISPVDRVRLPSIIAGILTTLSTLVALSVLGLAIGLARYDGTADANVANALGLGAGIWGAISALIAFALGGFVAARSAATASGPRNGIFNGAMMWMATIVLILLLLGGSISSLLGVATNAAATAAGTAASTAVTAGDAAAGDAAVPADPAGAVASAVQGADTTAERDQIAADASRAAWGVLLTLGLSAAAALIGGAMGSSADKKRFEEATYDNRSSTTP
jgi:hypothetical protein